MNLRKARLTDLPQLVNVWQSFMDEHRKTVCEHEPRYNELYTLKKDAQTQIHDYFRRMIHSKNALFVVAVEGDTIIGYALAKVKNNIPVYAVTHLGELSDLYIAADHRGTGIGRRLLDEADDWFRKQGLTWSTVGVNTANARARTLYKKHGYFDFHIDMRKKA